jgi:hypothetical protein
MTDIFPTTGNLINNGQNIIRANPGNPVAQVVTPLATGVGGIGTVAFDVVSLPFRALGDLFGGSNGANTGGGTVGNTTRDAFGGNEINKALGGR